MYAEGEPSKQVTGDIKTAVRDNNFIPLRSLNGAFPAHGDAASLAYSQSYSVIQFLREEYGQEKIQELIKVLAEGEIYDDALERVYGVNVDGLEQQWRDWVGVPLRPAPPTPTPFSAAAVPTMAPLAAPGDLATPESFPQNSAPQPENQPASSLCGLGLIPLIMLGVFTWQTRKPER